MVIVPECFMGIDICRALKSNGTIHGSVKGYITKAWMLFSSHNKPQNQANILNQRLETDQRQNKLLNICIGSPNRILKMIEMKALNISYLSHVIIYTKPNKKNFTIFDIKDCKADLCEILKLFTTQEITLMK